MTEKVAAVRRTYLHVVNLDVDFHFVRLWRTVRLHKQTTVKTSAHVCCTLLANGVCMGMTENCV